MNNKPLGIKNYGSIAHLPNSRLGDADHSCSEGQAIIATIKPRDKHDEVIVQEKLDGSNVGVAKVNGEIFALQRAGYIASSSPFKQHQLFAEWVRLNKDRFDELLKEGERVCGEWLAQAHGTRYNLKHEPFVAFDIMVGSERLPYDEFVSRIGGRFVIPNLLHRGQPISTEKALSLLNPEIHGAIDEIEGVVYRVQRKGQIDFLCKFVRQGKKDGKYLESETGQEPIWNIDTKELLRISDKK